MVISQIVRSQGVNDSTESIEYSTQRTDTVLFPDWLPLHSLMTSSSSIEFCEKTTLYGVDFTIVLSTEGDTTHWSTNDPDFKTPEGFGVGTSWDDISTDLRKSVSKEQGWGYYILLSSGWNLGFCEGSSCTESAPNSESTVSWVFKRNR